MNNVEKCKNGDNLLCIQVKKSMENILLKLEGFEKNDLECILCTNKKKLDNLHDLIKLYTLGMNCMLYHCSDVGEIGFKELFLVEYYLITFFKDFASLNINYIISFNNKNDELYRKSLKEQLFAIFRTFYQDNIININCESDIESFLYRYLKKIMKSKKVIPSKEDIDLTLVLLFLRKEYVRFMNIYSKISETFISFRLSLIIAIKDEDILKIEDIISKQKSLSVSKDNSSPSIFTDTSTSNLDHFEGIEEIMNLFETNLNLYAWISNQKNKIDWENNVKLWAKNRIYGSCDVDNSMIEICTKYLNFEDGWTIFKYHNEHNNNTIHKAIILCINGLHHSNSSKWISRLSEIFNIVFGNTEKFSCLYLIDVLFVKLENLSEEYISTILIDFSNGISLIEVDDESIYSLLRGYYSLILNNKKNGISSICFKYSIIAYNNWKQKHETFLFFFKNRSNYEVRIYSLILSICDLTKNCLQFTLICRDIKQNNTELNREIIKKLENFHKNNCKDCDFKNKQITSKSDTDGFLSHFFK